MNHTLSADWIDDLSAERYRPMMRLLDDGDFEFLRSQPGVTSKLIATVREQRCRIFRAYLRALNADFNRVCLAIKLLIADSGQDRPDLARVLLEYQARFALGMFRIQVRVAMFAWGWGRVDVSGLVSQFDGLRGRLITLAPAAI
jgi:hypothetical protein